MAISKFTKVCSKCRQDLPLAMFSRKLDGYAYYCKPCHKAYTRQHYLENKDKAKANATAWRMANRERATKNHHEYYLKNKEKNLAAAKAWAAKNPEKRKAISIKYRTEKLERARANEAAYRARNRESCNARIREWKAGNRPLVQEYCVRRRLLAKQGTPAWADQNAVREFYIKAAELRESTGQDWHVDHIVPLVSKFVCGLHCEANLQILPGKENLRKNNRTWPDMP